MHSTLFICFGTEYKHAYTLYIDYTHAKYTIIRLGTVRVPGGLAGFAPKLGKLAEVSQRLNRNNDVRGIFKAEQIIKRYNLQLIPPAGKADWRVGLSVSCMHEDMQSQPCTAVVVSCLQ